MFHPLLSSALERLIASIDGRLGCIFHRRVSRRRISHDGIDYSQLKGLKQVPGITRILRAPHVATLGLRISMPKSKNCANYTAPKSQAVRTRRSKIKSAPRSGVPCWHQSLTQRFRSGLQMETTHYEGSIAEYTLHCYVPKSWVYLSIIASGYP